MEIISKINHLQKSIKLGNKIGQIVWYNYSNSFIKMYVPVDKNMKIVFKKEKNV